MSDAKTCLITGVGPGTGRALVERFAAVGYKVAMLARSEDRLMEIAEATPNTHAFPCDVSSRGPIEDTLARIKSELGAPNVVIHNAVGGAFGTILDIDAAVLERNFQINTMALFHLAQLTLPDMVEAGHGVLLGTGNTSAYRGKANFVGFAPSKAAQRILLEGIARDMGPKGVH
ncbi:MAG: SDR family NAD(P)-dependent oxidoreductase, partial [Pseudomonadota bacterium]